MNIVKCQTKQWGNSLGIIVPRKVVKTLHLHPHEEILIEIKGKPANVLQELFGSGKMKRSTKEILKDVRKELDSRH